MLNIKYDNNLNFNFTDYYFQDKSWYETAEINTKKFFIDIIKPNFNIIDAGAQIGMYSVLFSKLATNGKVYAFEPTDTINMLKKNLEYNDCENVFLQNIALSNKTGIFMDKIFKVWSQNIIEEKEFEFITIDDFVKKNNLKINLIKIDVDSYDYEVLQGSKSVLESQKPFVLVELNHALSKRNYATQDAINFMTSVGYEIENVFDQENYLFVSK